RVREGQREGLVALVHRVVEDRNGDALARLAVGEGQRARLRRVVAAGGGGAIRGGVVDGDRPDRTGAAHDREGDRRIRLGYVRRRRRYRELPRPLDGGAARELGGVVERVGGGRRDGHAGRDQRAREIDVERRRAAAVGGDVRRAEK